MRKTKDLKAKAAAAAAADSAAAPAAGSVQPPASGGAASNEIKAIAAPQIVPSMTGRDEGVPAGVEALMPDEIKPARLDAVMPFAFTADTAEAAAADAGIASSRVIRVAMLAASLVLAAGIGAFAGVLGAKGVAQPAPVAVAKDTRPDVHALQESLTQLKTELAALRTSVEAGTRSTNAQFVKIGDKIGERVDRAQADPAAKLTKALEALDRIDRRTEVAARETTASIAPPAPTPAAVTPAAPSVPGWVVRDVYRGTAILQGRLGVIEVEAGDMLPGVGRIEAIRRQDGRWIVVTSKGWITSSLR